MIIDYLKNFNVDDRDMNKFINKYRDAISDDYKYKINRYLDKCLLHDTNDNDVLTLSKNLFKNDVKE